MSILAVKIKRTLSLLLVAVMLISFASSASAYNDNYPNTHRNTGKNIADLIAVARTQIGYTELDPKTGYPIAPNGSAGYTKYGESFGSPTGEWCAYFVSWCATNAGIPTSVVPRLGNCAATVEWYKKHSVFKTAGSGYVPKAGDIIFFNWSGGATAKHIGIVTGVAGDNVYTIEGNTGSDRGYQCCARTRSRSAGYIVGYGVPAYNDAKTYSGSHSFSDANQSGSHSDSVKYSTSKLAVITTSATEITATNAKLHGAITNGGRLHIATAGFFFGTDKLKLAKYPVVTATTASSLNLEMDVASKVGELTPNTTYYYQTYACIDGRDYLGPTYAVVTVNDIPQQLTLSEIAPHVGVGQTAEIIATTLPYGTESKGITWVSSDERIATVTNDGVIKGISYGNVRMTATTNYGSARAECNVTVLIPTPANVRAVAQNENKITVSWSAVNSAEGYIVYRGEGADAEMVEIARTDAKTTSFADTTVRPGNKHNYCIVTIAKEDKYNSDPSEAAFATAKLSAPAKISASFDDNTIKISWDATEGAERYYIYRSTSENGLYTNIGKAYANKFVDRTASPDCTYYYKVFADNGNERTRSSFSPAAVITTKSITLETKEIGLISPKEETVTENRNEAKLVRSWTKSFTPEF